MVHHVYSYCQTIMWPAELEMIIIGHSPFYQLDTECQNDDIVDTPDEQDSLGIVGRVINFFKWIYRSII